jgi:dephospho-CoA kinase
VIVLGLTGSIGMGKTSAAAMLRRMGLPVYEADAAVHRLLAPGGGAVSAVRHVFPGCETPDGGIDRRALGRIVFGDRPALGRLEAILHPRVREAERRFLAGCARRRVAVAVLDVPLLYETGGERRCDAVLVVSAPAFLQRARVMARPGMSEARFAAILASQLPDREKRRRTPHVITTGLGKRETLCQLRRHVALIRERHR